MISNFILPLAQFLQTNGFSADTKVATVSIATLETALSPPDKEQQ